MPRFDHALAGNREVLAQAARLLPRLSDSDYSAAGGAGGQSPIGAHLRHVLDHYRALVDGLAHGSVDYEVRHRDSALEHDRRLALAEVERLQRALEHLTAHPPDAELRVNLRSLVDAGNEPDWSRSTLKRELQFLVSHTVHHFALIRTRLTELGIDAGDEFGLAPSTILARRTNLAAR